MMSEHQNGNDSLHSDLPSVGTRARRTSPDWLFVALAAAVFLIAIIMPFALMHYRQTRARAQLKENLRQISLALEQYSQHQSTDMIKTEPEAFPNTPVPEK